MAQLPRSGVAVAAGYPGRSKYVLSTVVITVTGALVASLSHLRRPLLLIQILPAHTEV